jgi:thiol:disulfide interchange protein
MTLEMIMKSFFLRLSCLLTMMLGVLPSAYAQDPFNKNDSNSKSDVVVVNDEFLPVDQAYILNYQVNDKQLVLNWVIADGYYLYEERFKFSTIDKTTGEKVKLDAQYTPGKMKYDELFGRETAVHVHQVTATLDISSYTQAFLLKLEYQGCAEAGLCYPPQKVNLWVDSENNFVAPANEEQLQTSSKPASNSPETESQTVPTNDMQYDSGFVWQAMLFALLGGMILNLMPCVFPVLSLKVMHLAGSDKQHLTSHGWIYTLGIVISFIGFAAILLLARKGGEAIGWGFQLQSPGLIAALAYLFFVMGLSLSGLLNIGSSLMGTGQSLASKSGYSGSFFTGVLAAIVASPCTAPFMGTALGFALTQPYYVSLAVFASLGFGMALPLLLLCYIPALTNRLPQPGQWMETLKELLAFPIYIAAIWLLWVYGRQTSATSMAALALGGVFVAFACWLSSKYATGKKLQFNRLIILLSLLTAFYIPWSQYQSSQEKSDRWQAFSPELLQSLRDQGRPVFVDFTADWCITCLANEKAVLETEEIEAAFDQYKVATLKGDWTNSDPVITAVLQEYGRSGVPLYLYFPANRTGKAEVLPQLLTKDLMLETLKP